MDIYALRDLLTEIHKEEEVHREDIYAPREPPS